MSDGNFNRSMLPQNNYQSGVRAGQAQMKHIAQTAFREWLGKHHPEMAEEVLDAACHEFKGLLDRR